jgi:hypothetical protein
MLRIARHQLSALRYFEIFKIKPRSDAASHHGKRFPVRDVRRKPATCLDHRLKNFSGLRITSQENFRMAALGINYINNCREAEIKMPHFIRPQSMKCGEILSVQQK